MLFLRKLFIALLGPGRYFRLSRIVRAVAKPFIALGYRKYIPIFADIIRPGDLCFDVGANLGYTTDLVLKFHGRSLAIEPVGWCHSFLQHAYRNNSAVRVIRTAVGNQPGTAKLYVCDEANAISTLSPDWTSSGRYSQNFSWNRTETVSVETLDHLIKKYGQPRFINIDVEGFEYKVLEGLTHKVDFLAFEYTPEMYDQSVSCIRLLSKRFSIRLKLLRHDKKSLISKDWLPPGKFLPLLSRETDSVGDIFVMMK